MIKISRNALPFVLVTCVILCLVGFVIFSHIRNTSALSPCPCNIYPAGAVPVNPSVASENKHVSLGTQFVPAVNGYITGVRFYKHTTMTDAHTGSLWSSTGTLLASGSYTNETSSGWQSLTFSSPVYVTAGTTYVASMHTPTGKYIASPAYFNVGISNYPLNAPVGAGVFAYNGDVYPSSKFNNGGYWVDAIFRQNSSDVAPTVVSTSPLNNATSTYPYENITAVLDQVLDASTISTSTVKLTDGNNADVAVSVAYTASTKTITISPSNSLRSGESYVVSLRGGVGGVGNLDGTTLASDFQWTFTVGSDQCPCSIWNEGNLTSDPVTFVGSSAGTSLGQRIHADENGYLHAVRFYKSIQNTSSTHTVHVWTQAGVLLASATSSNETNYGWQEVPLPTAVKVTQGQNYVISYFSSDNIHVYSDGALATQAGGGPIHANAGGSYYASNSDIFPTRNEGPNATANFWIDAVFSTTDSYTAPFALDVSQPTDGSYGVSPTMPFTFKMSNAVDAATVGAGLSIKTESGTTISGAKTYDDSTHTITFTPATALTRGGHYTASITTSLKDVSGTAASATTISFTVGSELSNNINQGMGGPVLILTSSAYPYDSYLAEMLRTQGINYFDVKDISQLSASTLSGYSLVLLGKSTLTNANVSTLTTWVQGGGNLIAMQPDKKLASLLGLSSQNTTLSEAYLRVNATQDPGRGITSETMQYHHDADLYSPGGSTQVIATLYSNATTPTTNPAITQVQTGLGHAAAFLYDLPKSIALTHQGNPAWAGQDRDGNTPIRPNDLFNGSGGTDWLNIAKAHIPQADEQQRLLSNMMLTMSQPTTPLPQFWILPHGYKTAIVMAEDDHGVGAASTTYKIFDTLLNMSSRNCSVADWRCHRSTSLFFTTSGLTSNQANTSNALGFDLGVHIANNCTNYTSYSNLNGFYAPQVTAFKAKYSGIPAQRTNRTHCYLWSDWDSTIKADIANGVRFNLNYEWYPNTWTGANSGYLTGSGLTMRFTDVAGNLLDDYQGVTDLDYETDPTNTSVNAMLDNALNSNEFYGVLGTHYDTDSSYYRLLINSAVSHNIPLISSEQMIKWKDALGSSNFNSITSTKYKLSFTVQVAEGGQGMQAMIPTSTSNGSLSAITTSDGSSVSYATSVVKGVSYAIFNANPGSYTALYGTQPAPVVNNPSNPGLTNATVTSNSESAAQVSLITSITTQSPFVGEQNDNTDTAIAQASPSNSNQAIKRKTSKNEVPAQIRNGISPQVYVGGFIATAAVVASWSFVKKLRLNKTNLG